MARQTNTAGTSLGREGRQQMEACGLGSVLEPVFDKFLIRLSAWFFQQNAYFSQPQVGAQYMGRFMATI